MKQWSNRLLKLLLILAFLPIALKMIKIHPNQNVYFNPLIGGLKGAQEKDYPYWGLNLGSAYKQGVKWLNKHAEKNAKVALVIGTRSNIPLIYFRQDISLNNGYWSGSKREGEYLIEAVYQGWIREWHYAGEYVDRILKPVYEVKVDDVPILKIWKNDAEHTYPEYLNEKIMTDDKINWEIETKTITLIIEIAEKMDLTEVLVNYKSNHCLPFSYGQVFLSLDGEKWQLEREPVRPIQEKEGILSYPLAAKKTKYMKVILDTEKSCPFKIEWITIRHL